MTTVFRGRVALVIGASSRVGLAVANRFAIEGATVVLADTDPAVFEHADELRTRYGRVFTAVHAELPNPDSVRRMVFAALHAHGRLDYAFNNAMLVEPSPASAAIGAIDPSTHSVSGLWRCMKYEIAALLGGGGAIVNNAGVMDSVAGRRRLLAATRSAAMECASLGIRVNAVCPSSDDQSLIGDEPLPVGRPYEVAETVLWLCGEHSSFMGGIPAGYPPEGWVIETTGRDVPCRPH